MCSAEHSIDLDCDILLINFSILARKSRHVALREVMEMELHPNGMNWEDGFFRSRS